MRWRRIRSFPLYEVSSSGLVRRRATGHVLIPWKAGAGYSCLTLYKAGKRYKRYVAHLVAWAFLGRRRLGRRRHELQINHLDGNKANNAASNLEYTTAHLNHRHASERGLAYRGTLNGQAKLSEKDVLEIRGKRQGTYAQIAKMYGVHVQLIYQIRARKIWKHLP